MINKNFVNSSYRYDKFIMQIHQACMSMSVDKSIMNEERRRLILIDEFIKMVAHANTINYDNVNIFMRMYMTKKEQSKAINKIKHLHN